MSWSTDGWCPRRLPGRQHSVCAANERHFTALLHMQALELVNEMTLEGIIVWCLRKNAPTLKRYSSKSYRSILMTLGRNIQKYSRTEFACFSFSVGLLFLSTFSDGDVMSHVRTKAN